ncbi:unnamed protein product [Hermetia illucens]|uniref:Mismatch repair endonuclease PMS2 n=1 Tax=Hermetia illucens TaxID=343691 RepID=A0A7R8UNB2_HERIL|nr:mismatch repair endonuclease PMS2 [Hermetia illucens]CAD7083664.1 unnamed protein product [Hermetia illucens]
MEPEQIECADESSKEIKAIGKDTVHRICSGQVVLSLAIAVKELVENCIDAGATLVEVKLKKQGLESIEVVDNGAGVEEKNFQGLTAKHYTSKLRDFEDLRSVDTFGFRGEALSSLCALCDVSITTRHTSAEIGTKLELDHSGNIKIQTACARCIGTTVTLTNIFGTLPVRQRELSKNIKAEFNKMCQILRAYCLVTKGVRIICTNQNSKGIWQTFLCTRGSQTALANIEDIYGAKEIQNLMEIKQPVEEGKEEGNILDLQDLNTSLDISTSNIELSHLAKFKFEGWISSCAHGSGHKLKDRQYFFVNSRPCEPKQIIKAVNEIYHRYNLREYPFVYLNILTSKSDVDVNLTPDKRQLLINNEKLLILAIKLALTKTFQVVPSTFRPDQTIHSVDLNKTAEKEDDDENFDLTSSQEKFKSMLSQWKATGNTGGNEPIPKVTKRKQMDEITVQKMKLAKIQQYLERDAGSSVPSAKTSPCKVQQNETSKLAIRSPEKSATEEEASSSSPSADTDDYDQPPVKAVKMEIFEPISTTRSEQEVQAIAETHTSSVAASDSDEEPPSQDLVYDDDSNDIGKTFFEESETISITPDEIEALVIREEKLAKSSRDKANLAKLKFKAEINPSKNKNAEEELEGGITKDMFARMDIIGQYNLGFIIVKFDDDLFIVDQHATDEMYNFEMLQRSTQLQSQKLAVPKTLEFTTVNEMILMDNLEVFKANGFEFEIDQEAPATRRVKLLSKPFSKNWEFGKNDIDELIFMLHDAPPNTMCRPSRIRSMFASRACRKSVMIGTALKQTTMRQLIDHMGEVDKPWNCPHGRPTMRHLVNLAMLNDQT